ncbi:MAG TPA: tetratricopeptide repeat protein [Helicobacteraceae bacterium]|nr:tetratricopeptide repeat protein [Helicobacteraceae bacterium]
MNPLFIEFRDPLFGIIVFFALVFVIAFFSYWWGRYKTKEDHRHLDNFMQQFHTLPQKDELIDLVETGNISDKSWHLLASSYFQNGEFEKTIEIYQTLVKHQKDALERRDTLFLLGRTYFKAGFLERARDIFLQILKTNPRTPQALHYLLLVYEHLRQYDKAFEVLEPLDELGEDASLDRYYLQAIALIHNNEVSQEEKTAALIAIHDTTHQLSYLIFEYLFKHDPDQAWEHLDQSQCQRLSDILWQLPAEDYNFDIIATNGFLRELFSAKGSVNLAKESDVFELDVLIKLNQHGANGATLSFEYLCRECKHVLPFSFHRCPNCYAIDSLICEPNLTKDMFEKNLSFQ